MDIQDRLVRFAAHTMPRHVPRSHQREQVLCISKHYCTGRSYSNTQVKLREAIRILCSNITSFNNFCIKVFRELRIQ
jgi:hypothetical protein